MKEIELFNDQGLCMNVPEEEVEAHLLDGWSPLDPLTPETRAMRKERNAKKLAALREQKKAERAEYEAWLASRKAKGG